MTEIKIKDKTIEIKKDSIYNIIRKYATDNNVLDIGCAGNSYEKGKTPRPESWLHGHINKYAKRCIGLDIDKEEVELLNSLGYNCIFQNAEEPFELDKKFDVIFTLYVIYYLDPVVVLNNVKRHLKEGGYFIVDAPNAFYYKRFLNYLLKKKNPSYFGSSICLYDPKTMCNLLIKHGFEISEIYWVYFKKSNSPWSFLLNKFKEKWDYFEARFLVVAKNRNTENKYQNG